MPATNLSDRISVDPDICFGKPCVKGTRIWVVDVLDNLAGGSTPNEIVEDFPELSLEDISAVPQYAAQMAERQVIIAA
jgi:uncharacterized protein (DUF433 family)